MRCWSRSPRQEFTIRTRTQIPVALRRLTVLESQQVTPSMQRVTLTGPQLRFFTDEQGRHWPAMTTMGFDDDLRVILPHPGEREPVLPLIVDGRVTFAEGRRPLARAYTLRRLDVEGCLLDIDVFLHEGGVGSCWASTAQPGDTVHVAGPGVLHGALPAEQRIIAIGDDTALPALARLLEELPPQAEGTVLVMACHPRYLADLPRPAGVTMLALPPQESAAACAHAITASLDSLDLAGPVTAWIAGEQEVVATVRRHLVSAHAVAPSRIDFSGYWRRGGALV